MRGHKLASWFKHTFKKNKKKQQHQTMGSLMREKKQTLKQTMESNKWKTHFGVEQQRTGHHHLPEKQPASQS